MPGQLKIFLYVDNENYKVIDNILVVAESFSYLGIKLMKMDFSDDAVVKNPPADAGDTGSSPGPHMLWSN